VVSGHEILSKSKIGFGDLTMPYLKCCKCHHEWEGAKSSKCDWCGAKGEILEEKTPLEKMLKAGYLFILDPRKD
jgi:hypothetical protein